MEGTSGYYVWRAVSRDGVAYLCGRRKRRMAPGNEADELRLRQTTLLASRDRFAWTQVGVVQAEYGGESAFLFEPDGSLLAIVRNRAAALRARLCRAGAPHRGMDRARSGPNIGGPLLVRWGRNLLVGGRKANPPDRAVTALYWLVDDRLQDAAELPSAGDNSYPGFVELSPSSGLLSYYYSSPVDTDAGASGTVEQAARPVGTAYNETPGATRSISVELALHEAETRRLSELVTAAENGERVVITRHGEPLVELVRCHHKRGGINFGKLESDRRRLGINGDEER